MGNQRLIQTQTEATDRKQHLDKRTKQPESSLEEVLGSRAASRHFRAQLQRHQAEGAASPNPLHSILSSISPVSPRVIQAKPMFRGLSYELTSALQQDNSSLLQRSSETTADNISVSEGQQENKMGLPDNLKAGIEKLSGLAMDDVKVHYNSSRPVELQALAYTQGTDIYVGPGQEQHLPHEAWHVVQQNQGRVKPTMQMKNGVPVNDDKRLENEADLMGRRAVQMKGDVEDTRPELGVASIGQDILRTVAPEITPQFQPVAQLQVFPKPNGKFYSDLDPWQEFNTQQEALDFEAKMEPPPPISGGRSATLFTYTATKSHNKLSTRGIPQGPHTMGHAAIETALFSSEDKIALIHLVSEQVRTPSEWRDIVNIEYGQYMFDGKSETSCRILRAYKDYNGLYQELMRVLAGTSDENPYDLVHELIQLDPYTVYKFTKPESVKKKHLKGKGENRDLSNPKNIDTNANFKQKRKYQETIEDRLLMLDYDYVPEDDEYVSDQEMAMEIEEDNKEYRQLVVNDALHFFSPDEVPNDGNCFFQSMLNLGHGASVMALRHLAKANGGQANIEQNGIWANPHDLTAVAKALGIRIRVISLDLAYRPIQDSTYGNAGPVVLLAHIFGGHFVPLRDE